MSAPSEHYQEAEERAGVIQWKCGHRTAWYPPPHQRAVRGSVRTVAFTRQEKFRRERLCHHCFRQQRRDAKASFERRVGDDQQRQPVCE